MPAKNSVKIYIKDGIYHVYNRGVEKRDIFLDAQDYQMFLYLLKYYLSIPHPDDIKQLKRTLAHEVSLLAFCLMPNHYHFLLQQLTSNGMTKLVRAVCISYVGYFNQKYKRVGGFFQGKYKAASITNDANLLYTSAYIHRNPLELGSNPLSKYSYSSYNYYLKSTTAHWINAARILSFFSSAQSLMYSKFLTYESFVTGFSEDFSELLGNLALDAK